MNTVLVTVDALRADHLAQYGYDRDTMPVLDELCDQGVRYASAYSNAPYTRISVPAIQTSRRLGYTGLNRVRTLASVLGENGVDTCLVGTQVGMNLVDGEFGYDENVDLGRDDFQERATGERPLGERLLVTASAVAGSVSERLGRFERLHGTLQSAYRAVVPDPEFNYKGYVDAAQVTDRVLRWLEGREGGDFFLWVHYMEGHRPYGVHDDDPAFLDGPLDEGRIRELMKKAGTEPEAVSPAERDLLVDLYDSDLRYCSRHLRRLLEHLRASEDWDETNLLFASDHGEEFGEHGRFFHRNYPYDELIHVPLVVRTPETTGEVVHEQRELLDVAPTVCELHGVDTDGLGFEGTPLSEGGDRDVVALGSGTADEGERTLAARIDGWKYVHSEATERLYDLEADPEERENVVRDHPEVVDDIRGRIPDGLFERDPERLSTPDDDVDRRQLEALGYMETKSE
jgi:arylsulfatase A-like enzyme